MSDYRLDRMIPNTVNIIPLKNIHELTNEKSQ